MLKIDVGMTAIKPYLSIYTVGLVCFARYCGKMYSRYLFPYCGLFNFALHQNPPLKDLVTKMLLHAKLSFFAYVISEERNANQPKQLWNDTFHVKTS